jgi:GntR family transcriptional regulator
MPSILRPAQLPKRGRPSKYLAIRDWLAARIANGDYRSGAQLPSEHDIMARFEVSRVTARQALDDLRRLGLVFSLQGKGYFVRRLKAVLDLLRLQSFGEMMAPLGLPTSSRVLDVSEVEACRDVAEALRLDPNERVVEIKRARLAGNSVISMDVSYFPLDVGRRLVRLDLASEDVFTLLENELETGLGFADLVIEAVPASDEQAGYLDVREGDSILRIKRLTHDDCGRPVDFEYLYARLDTFQFRVRSARW